MHLVPIYEHVHIRFKWHIFSGEELQMAKQFNKGSLFIVTECVSKKFDRTLQLKISSFDI